MGPVAETGRRSALLVATSSYSDPDLRQLRAPGLDASELAAVLGDPQIGDFEVEVLANATSGEMQEGIEDFCTDRSPDDQLFIYLSCHGVLDSYGRLYYAATNTRRHRLAATAVGATWLNERLDDCWARRQILVLDCCHSGAFAHGAKADDSDLALQQRFVPHGRGRVVLTASRGTEYSFEGGEASGEGVPSVFTHAIVTGLRTGDADRDRDGLITVTDLYQYVYEAVRAVEPRQNPELWTYGAEGNLVIARSVRGAVVEPVPLPEDLRVTLESPRLRVRESAVAELAEILDTGSPGSALTARQELERIAAEDHPQVAALARIATAAAAGTAAEQIRSENADRAQREDLARKEAARRREAEQRAAREAAERAEREAAAAAQREAEAAALAEREAAGEEQRKAATTASRPAEPQARVEPDSAAEPLTVEMGGGKRSLAGIVRVRGFRLAAAGTLAAVAVLVVVLVPLLSSRTTAVRLAGGTAVFAEQPLDAPDYIFPFASSAYDTVANVDDFQYLLYRPLYWFGDGAQPTLNTRLSLADPPVVSGRKVTITLKHYEWSDGSQVTATDVAFWLHMEQAVGSTDYFGYSGFPNDVVTSIDVVSKTKLIMITNKVYSQTWLLYNNLSQITPMPLSWDVTAHGHRSNCASVVSDCARVYGYLNAQAQDTNSYTAREGLWSTVDGPWKLSAYSTTGDVVFVRNKSYSGSQAGLARFVETPFASDAAEYTALRSSTSAGRPDVGYLPLEDAPPATARNANPLARAYSLAPLYDWGISFYWLNFQSTVSDHAAIIRQPYFRQVLALLVDQRGVIHESMKGYGQPTTGPVPAQPVTGFASAAEEAGTPYPFNPKQAVSLLKDHGWTVAPGAVTTCGNPRLCGQGISLHTALSFNFPYVSGAPWFASELTVLRTDAEMAGIRLNLQPEQVTQLGALLDCGPTRLSCKWDMGTFGSWDYFPAYLPTGDQLFNPTDNLGDYSDGRNEEMISQTLASDSPSLLYGWEDYVASQVPLIWMPAAAYSLTEVASNLKGVTPQSSDLTITPEDWYFVN